MNLKNIIAPAIVASVALGTFASASAGGPDREAKGDKPHKIELCHEGDDGEAKLISVSANASLGHARHGDNIPGGEVHGMEGFVYDDDCTPVSTGLAGGCYDSIFFYDLKFNGKSGQLNNSNFVLSRDGSCNGANLTPMTLVDAPDKAAAMGSCDAIGAPKNSALSLASSGFSSMPSTSWLCR